MQEVIDKLEAIEKKHSDFFVKKGKNITDFITRGGFNNGVFINVDLPKEIIDKIRKVFDEYSVEK